MTLPIRPPFFESNLTTWFFCSSLAANNYSSASTFKEA
jgi:hypothetical protein